MSIDIFQLSVAGIQRIETVGQRVYLETARTDFFVLHTRVARAFLFIRSNSVESRVLLRTTQTGLCLACLLKNCKTDGLKREYMHEQQKISNLLHTRNLLLCAYTHAKLSNQNRGVQHARRRN